MLFKLLWKFGVLMYCYYSAANKSDMETSIERGKWGEIDWEQRSRVLTIATREFQKKLCKDQKIIWQRGEKNWVLDARSRAAASQFIPGGCLKRWKGHEMLAAQISFPKGVANKFNNPVQRDFNYKISRRFIHVTKTPLSTHTPSANNVAHTVAP